MVRKGDRGEHVRYAQDCLRSLGYRGPVDGVYSARVESAVRSVQKSQSLPVTGVVDRRTWAALKQQHY